MCKNTANYRRKNDVFYIIKGGVKTMFKEEKQYWYKGTWQNAADIQDDLICLEENIVGDQLDVIVAVVDSMLVSDFEYIISDLLQIKEIY